MFLQQNALLALDADGPYLTRRSGGPRHALTIGETVGISLLAHCGDELLAQELANEIMGPSGSNWIQHVLKRYATYFGAGTPMELEVEWLAGLKTQKFPHSPRRQAAPSAVTWLVTLACNRKCPYCFYKVTPHYAASVHSPSDCNLSYTAALTMIEEMADIGAADLYLTGGEPLLRKDLTKIIAFASLRNVRAHMVTKYPIDDEMAASLADAGLHEVTFSLDDARAHVAAALAGANGFLGEATLAIKALATAQIPTKVNAVVSAVNEKNLEQLTELLIDLGVSHLSLAAYVTPQPARSNTLKLAPPSRILERRVRELQEKYIGEISIEINGSALSSEISGRSCGRHTDCDVGIDALDVLPNGQVTRCRYLPHDSRLVVGDLRRQSIMDIWNGDTLQAFQHPEPSAYKETNCHDCSGFEFCNSRGRCYFTALINEKRIHAPDVFCTRRGLIQ